MIQKLKKSNAGFTLVELLVVIAILGVLSAILVPQYLQYVDKAREGTDKATFGEILHAAEVAGAQTGLTGTIDVTYVSNKIVISNGATGGAGATVATAMTAIITTNATLQSTDGKAVVASAATITITSNGASWTSTGTATAIAALG